MFTEKAATSTEEAAEGFRTQMRDGYEDRAVKCRGGCGLTAWGMR